MVSCGANERLNTVPRSELPPRLVVPYRVWVLADKVNPAYGLPVADASKNMKIRKTCAITVEGENRAIARTTARPCRPIQVLPDKINRPSGLAPSLLV